MNSSGVRQLASRRGWLRSIELVRHYLFPISCPSSTAATLRRDKSMLLCILSCPWPESVEWEVEDVIRISASEYRSSKQLTPGNSYYLSCSCSCRDWCRENCLLPSATNFIMLDWLIITCAWSRVVFPAGFRLWTSISPFTRPPVNWDHLKRKTSWTSPAPPSSHNFMSSWSFGRDDVHPLSITIVGMSRPLGRIHWSGCFDEAL